MNPSLFAHVCTVRSNQLGSNNLALLVYPASQSVSQHESKETRRQLAFENVKGHINRMEHLEAIQTELESLILVATTVYSGMINWDAEIPQAVGIYQPHCSGALQTDRTRPPGLAEIWAKDEATNTV